MSTPTPTSLPQQHGLAARMGRWSATHWKKATFGWLAFVLVAFALGGLVGTKNVDSNAGPGESGRMQKILDAGFKQPAGESVLIESRSARVGDVAFTAAINDVIGAVSKLTVVQQVHRGAISRNQHAALVDFQIRGDKNKAVDKIQPVLDAVAAAQQAHPGFAIGEFGDASAQKGVETAYGKDLGKAGMLSLPVTLIILVLAFGALVAAGIPLLLGLTAVFATFGLIALPSHLLPVAVRGAGDGAPDRARGRRRLLDVLLEARTPGAGGRAQPGGRARGRRGDLRPFRADLRADGDGSDGRHVPDRRRDVHLARAGDHPRRRRCGARLADRAARRCSRGSATTSTGCASHSSAGTAATTARAGSGARSSTASSAGPRCRRRSRPGCCWRSPRRRCSCTSRRRGPSRSRSRSRSSRRTSGCSRRSPARRCRQTSSSRPRACTRRQCAQRSRSSSGGRSPAAAPSSRSPSTSTSRARSRTSPSRSRGTEPTPPRTRPSTSCATRSSPRRSAPCRTRRPASPG